MFEDKILNLAIMVPGLNSGGAERIAGILSKKLSKKYNVYLFLLSTEDIVYEYGGTIVDVKKEDDAFYEYTIKFYKQKYNIDVAISFTEELNFANIRTRCKEKVIISEGCVQSLIEPPMLAKTDKIHKYYSNADEIIAFSEETKLDKWVEAVEDTSQEVHSCTNIDYQMLDNAKKIYIYGAGYVGKIMYLRLKAQYDINGFVVSDKTNNMDSLYGLTVYDVNEIMDKPSETVFTIGVNRNNHEDIVRVLADKGYYNWVYPFVNPCNYMYYSANSRLLNLKDEVVTWYCLKTGKNIDIEHPVTYNEKIQWLKVYDNTEIKTLLSDKYLVREYIEKTVGAEYLVPFLGVWDSFDEINWEELPEQFALKCNHGSGTNLIVKNKKNIDIVAEKIKFDYWMQQDYALCQGFEMQYSNIKRRIYAEQYIEQSDGDLRDYKIHCFYGKPKIIQVIFKRNFEKHTAYEAFFDTDWKRNDLMYHTYEQYDGDIDCPLELHDMLCLAEKLSVGFRYVRVDLYIVKQKLYFGELTFTPASGVGKWKSEYNNKLVGDMIDIN